MISTFRMKTDLIGQILLITAILLLAVLQSNIAWTNAFIIILGCWQILSAIHLLIVYRHVKRINFLKAFLVLVVSLPLWIKLIGQFAYLPVAGVLIWYFIQTIYETRIILRRPRSFWDL